MRIKIVFALFIVFASGKAFGQMTGGENGLSNTSTKVLLGGTLTTNTSIDLGASFTFNLKKSTANYFHLLNNGNLGLGLTNPTTRLHLYKNTTNNFNTMILMEDGLANGYTMMGFKGLQRTFHVGLGNQNETTLGLANKFFIHDQTAALTRLVIDANGNVGIGKTNPQFKLDVNGSFSFGGTNATSEIQAGGTGRLTINTSLINSLTGSNYATFNMGDYTQQIGTGTHLSVLNSNSSGHIWVGNSLNSQTHLYHSGQTGSGIYDWTFTGTNYRLFELGQGTIKMPVLATGTGNGTKFLSVGEDGSIQSGGAWSLTGNTLLSDGSQFMGSTNAQPLSLRTSGIERMKIFSNGNVSISTPNDNGSKLHVEGTTTIKGWTGVYGDDSYFQLHRQNIGPIPNLFEMVNGNGGSLKMGGGSSNGFSPMITLKPDGVVSNWSYIIGETMDAGIYPAITIDARKGGGPLVSQDLLGIGSYGNYKLKLAANGNISLVSLKTLNTAPTTTGTTKMVVTDELGQLSFAAIPSGGSGSSQWTTSGNTINYSNGQVIIGTQTGTSIAAATEYKLAVGGAIIAEKVKVKLQSSGWPDYVFQKGYVLPSLKEVEAFIKQYKHLPDVPSAKEVEEKGLDVGDNQAVLLKKIEELTLYMIEINKKVEKLEEENERLKAKSK